MTGGAFLAIWNEKDLLGNDLSDVFLQCYIE